MVIGKDKIRIKTLEEAVKKLNDNQVVVNNSIKSIQEELAQIKEIIENAIEDGAMKKTPQQLVNEWFNGGEDDA